MKDPIYRDDFVTLYQGDSLSLLKELPDHSVDAVVTDPPYSSGGFARSDRNQKTSSKYVINGTAVERPEFFGDNRDQRSLLAWCSLWLSECIRITRPRGYLLTFTDWRSLPIMTDAVQAGGWVWRGIVPWDKTESARPQMGWFRAQCEYVLTASNGSMGAEQDRSVKRCLPGLFRGDVKSSEKLHITGKPVWLMSELLNVLPPGSVILDPFAGSGTTLWSAKQKNMRSIGIEMSREYCEIIKNRVLQEVLDFSEPTLSVEATA